MTLTLPYEVTATYSLVDPALRAAVAELDPALQHIVNYHFGWTNKDGESVEESGGKALRPALSLLAAQAVHSEPEMALPGAVAAELVHNFSLLHDDVMDGDVERRHRPTVWRLFGTPAAILAGDALLTLAIEMLNRSDPTVTCCLTTTVQRLISGQNSDVEFENRTDVEIPECLGMGSDKTAALMRFSTQIGALLGGAGPATAALLAEFGHDLGMAFQLVDDLLGIQGSSDSTGKPVLADLRVRKKSVPVVVALNSGSNAGIALKEMYLSSHSPTEEELHTMVELIEHSGALEWTRERAQYYTIEAISCLDQLSAPATIHAALKELTHFTLERDR